MNDINARVAEAIGYKGSKDFDPENNWDEATWALDVYLGKLKKRPDDSYRVEVRFGVAGNGHKWAAISLDLETIEPPAIGVPPKTISLLSIRDLYAETPALAICSAILGAGK